MDRGPGGHRYELDRKPVQEARVEDLLAASLDP
jgi:hypothetical protein